MGVKGVEWREGGMTRATTSGGVGGGMYIRMYACMHIGSVPGPECGMMKPSSWKKRVPSAE